MEPVGGRGAAQFGAAPAATESSAAVQATGMRIPSLERFVAADSQRWCDGTTSVTMAFVSPHVLQVMSNTAPQPPIGVATATAVVAYEPARGLKRPHARSGDAFAIKWKQSMNRRLLKVLQVCSLVCSSDSPLILTALSPTNPYAGILVPEATRRRSRWEAGQPIPGGVRQDGEGVSGDV
jgi:hypothetical protein